MLAYIGQVITEGLSRPVGDMGKKVTLLNSQFLSHKYFVVLSVFHIPELEQLFNWITSWFNLLLVCRFRRIPAKRVMVNVHLMLLKSTVTRRGSHSVVIPYNTLFRIIKIQNTWCWVPDF
jgi:hypothetical protein